MEREDWKGNRGFLLAQSCRVIQNRIDMSADVASFIYESIPEEERLSIREDYNKISD